ncbi:MAG: hypothetical protein WD153_03430 [Candidatus Paceibacterota bacterium]
MKSQFGVSVPKLACKEVSSTSQVHVPGLGWRISGKTMLDIEETERIHRDGIMSIIQNPEHFRLGSRS